MSNIVIVKSSDFGNPDYGIIQVLLDKVDVNMSDALGIPPFSTCSCMVEYTDNDPICCKDGCGHKFFLSANDSYYCQWVYQFAHEYCHHLINGTLSGKWSKLLWFEETLCELSSLYNLYLMEHFCKQLGWDDYSMSVHGYLSNLLTKNNHFQLSPTGGWLTQYESILCAEGYQRDLYNAIAVQMFPFFIDNPRLWKMILHIGDIRQWNSLDELFDHLQANADSSYSDSLQQLRKLFS